MKKSWIVLSVALVLLAVAAYLLYGSKNSSTIQKSPSTNPKTVKVGVSQIVSHVGIDAVREGIVAGFANNGYKEGENIVFDFQNAQGEASINQSIAQKFANSDYDLFMPIGTQASQVIANLIKNKPIVFASVTDPVTAGLVKSNQNPGGNITGTSDITLYREHLDLLKKLKPDVKKVGLLYNPGEANSKFSLEETKKYGNDFGFEFVVAPVNNTNEILSAARSIVDKVDAFYILPDNTVVAGEDALIKVALEAKKPLIAVDQSGVEKGALATLGTNYKKVGERTAEMALRVLKGENPENISVLGVTDADLFINTKTAQVVGIVFSDDLIKQAKQIYK